MGYKKRSTDVEVVLVDLGVGTGTGFVTAGFCKVKSRVYRCRFSISTS